MVIETHARSFLKAASYRCFSTLVTSVLFWILTREWQLALLAGGIEALLKLLLYYLHERWWECCLFGKKEIIPPVIWFTGLSGAGKTTLARAILKELKSLGFKCELLDGDEIRDLLPPMGFSEKDRNTHVSRVGILAKYLQRNGVASVVSLISPYRESRNYVRRLCDNFYEVYVETPLEICEKRDPKGLYQKARMGEIQNFTGIDAPYEIPQHPEIIINTESETVDSCVKKVLEQIQFPPTRSQFWTISDFWSLKPFSS